MPFDDSVKLIWSLTSNGPMTAVSAAGNSGTWGTNPSARTPVDTRRVDDLWLSVIAAGGAGSTLKVQVNFYDGQGNLFQFITGTTPLLGVSLSAAPGQSIAFGGRHGGGGSGNYIVPSEWAQVAWTIGSGSMTGVEIALYGR